MTSEQRTFIEAQDIVAIEFECLHCHAKSSVSIADFREPPIRCHACDRGGQWLIPGAEEYMRIRHVVDALRHLSLPHANGDRRFLLKFEIKADS